MYLFGGALYLFGAALNAFFPIYVIAFLLGVTMFTVLMWAVEARTIAWRFRITAKARRPS